MLVVAWFAAAAGAIIGLDAVKHGAWAHAALAIVLCAVWAAVTFRFASRRVEIDASNSVKVVNFRTTEVFAPHEVERFEQVNSAITNQIKAVLILQSGCRVALSGLTSGTDKGTRADVSRYIDDMNARLSVTNR